MRRYTVEINGTEHVIDVEEITADSFRVLVGAQLIDVHLRGDEDLAQASITPAMGPISQIDAPRPASTPALRERAVAAPPTAPAPRRTVASGAASIPAPMPGVIVTVETSVGATVSRGQVVVVLEAMKMKNAIRANRDGVVAEVLVQPGQQVGYGDPLLRFEG